jgi:uncharacterized repeat protein (TIGR01451 family)
VRRGIVLLLSTVLSLGLTMASPPPVRAAELHVCSSCPYKKIQKAIDAASSGDTVMVAQGTYDETVKIINKDITLLGGYTSSDWETQGDPSTTIIDANGAGATVEVQGANAVVDNFTITGGAGHYSEWHDWTRGGGLFIWDDHNRSIVISDNIIEWNSAGEGGALCVEGVENRPLHAQILRNVITNNSANVHPRWGGAFTLIYTTAVVKDNIVTNNGAKWGGGFHIWKSAPTIEGNYITNNIADGSSERVGGGFFIELSSAFIRNNIIANNRASDYAAGIYIKIPYPSQPRPEIVNNTIVANNTDGIVVRDNANPIIRNNIIALNGAGITRYDGGVVPVMSNNDVWGNNRDYWNIRQGVNDISADPLFVDQDGGDYHIRAGSPCIDTGTNQDAPNSDFERDSRPLDGDLDGTALWDIGADERRIPYRLQISKEVDPVSAEPGDNIVFTITCSNEGGGTLTGVTVTDDLSEHLLNLDLPPECHLTSGRTYECAVGNLAPGAEGSMVIGATIDRRMATPGVISNTAEGDSAETDPVSDYAVIIVGGLKAYAPLGLTIP